MIHRPDRFFLALGAALGALLLVLAQAYAQDLDGEPLIDITNPEFQPVPIAVSSFAADPALGAQATEIRQIVEDDLERSGLFQIIPQAAHIATLSNFDVLPQFADWRAINAAVLVTGRVTRAADGRLVAQFRVFDTAAEEQLAGKEVLADPADLRRVGHQIADGVYVPVTGEGPYFDSEVVFVAESGPKGDRQKRLAVMDQDGANVRYLADASGLVLQPVFSPNGDNILYISYNTGAPEVFLMSLKSRQRERLGSFPGMSFSPQFSPTGGEVLFSLSIGGNTDLYAMSLSNRARRRLTRSPGIETSASYSPDGSQIVFESDRSGRQQLYVMPAGGGEGQRISFGQGSYGTPIWSPKGDLIAFTKIVGGRFHIGVMRPDGSDERLLSTSFLDESPTFAPNGRVLMFYRETPGAQGTSQVMSIDVTGRNLRRVATPGPASDPSWSPLRN